MHLECKIHRNFRLSVLFLTNDRNSHTKSDKAHVRSKFHETKWKKSPCHFWHVWVKTLVFSILTICIYWSFPRWLYNTYIKEVLRIKKKGRYMSFSLSVIFFSYTCTLTYAWDSFTSLYSNLNHPAESISSPKPLHNVPTLQWVAFYLEVWPLLNSSIPVNSSRE